MKKKNINPLGILWEENKTVNRKELTLEETAKAAFKEMKTLRINSTFTMVGELLSGQSPRKTFLDSNDDLITKIIETNETLKLAIEELSHVYNHDDTVFNYILITTKNFVKDLVEIFLSTEISYLIHLKKNYTDTYKEKIEGELLNYDLTEETFSINERGFDKLLNRVGFIVDTYSILLRMKNSEWREEYFKLHKNNLEEKSYTEKHKIIVENKPAKKNLKAGRKGTFNSESELHQKILSISDWKNLSKNGLAKKLGYQSSSGLNELLKSKKWNLPQ